MLYETYNRIRLWIKRRFYDSYQEFYLDERQSGPIDRGMPGPEQVWDEHFHWQLSFLKDHGLRPDHKLLDYGCGPIRAGLKIAIYLKNGKYHGVDINHEAVQYSKEVLSGTQHKVNLCSGEDYNEPGTHDYIWAQSVLTHMNKSQVEQLLRYINTHASKGTTLLATFHLEEKYCKYLNRTSFGYPLNFFKQFLDPQVKLLEEKTPKNQNVFKVEF